MAVPLIDVMEDMKQRALRGEPPEELDPELALYLEDGGAFGPCIKHPLYYHMIYAPPFAAVCNEQFRAKKRHVRELLEDRELESVIWFYERPYRLRQFLELDQNAWNKYGGLGFRPQSYWSMLGNLWVDTENMWQDYDLWHKALHDERPCRWAIMDREERVELRKLRRRKTPILIFRGYAHTGPDRGFSWTLSRTRAGWFAERYAGVNGRDEPTMVTAVVDAENIIARFDSRGEEEVVVLPEHVHVVKTTRL